MGWLIAIGIASLVTSVVGIGISSSYQEESISQQEESNRINSYNASTEELNASITTIENTLHNIQSTESESEKYQSEIDVSNEWLENYRKMLSGDRSDTTIGIEMRELEGSKRSAENAKSAYIISSTEEKQSAYTAAYNEYVDKLKQQSLLNVAASGSGQLEGAYSAAQLIQNQKIRDLIGNDMMFNSDGEGISLSDGSFLVSYTNMQKSIALQLEEYSTAIETASGNITKQLDAYETMSKQYETTIDDRTKAIELNKEAIETYKQAIRNEQTNAVTALKKAMETRANDMDKTKLESDAERLDAANKLVEKHTGESASYNATDTINEIVAKEKAVAESKAKENAKASSESSSSRDREEASTKTISNSEKTAERDNEKGKTLTEQTKNSDEYKQQQAQKNSQAANEIGKSQTEYYQKQLEAQKQAEEEKKKNKTTTVEKGTNRRRTTQ